MGFGLSFGSKSQKSKTTSDVSKHEDTTQQQTGTQKTTGTTTVASTGSTTGQTTTQQAGTSSNVGTQTGTTEQVTKNFSDETLANLEASVQRLFGQTAGPKTVVGDFDPDKFVSEGLASAKATQQTALEESIGGLNDNVGGTASTNSAVALLENRLRGDSAANLGGIEANLNAQANDIVRQNALAGNTIDATNQGFLTQLLSALRGGISTTSGTESQATTQQGQTTNTGQQNTAEQTQSNQVQTQDLLVALNQLLTGSTDTTGHELTKTKGKSSGGGISLSL